MKNKRAQFYIIAALLIVLAVSGLASISTYAIVKQDPKIISSLSSDLKSEGARIVDYGIYNSQDISSLLNDFTNKEFAPYFLEKVKNSNVLFVYGNQTNLYGTRYNLTDKGTISATIGGESEWYMTGPSIENININLYPGQDFLKVNLLNKTFQFELRENEMFYFIIAQEKEGEIYVERN